MAASSLPYSALHAFGARTGSESIREEYARRAGLRGVADLVNRINDPGIGVPQGRDRAAMLPLARLLMAQDRHGELYEFARQLLVMASDDVSVATMPEEARRLLVERLLLVGESMEAERVIASISPATLVDHLLLSDVLNPHLGGRGQEATWLQQFNRVFTRFNLPPVAVRGGDSAPIDRLVPAARVARVVTGPLITVVMSAFRPGPELLTAVRSIIGQSWQRWELVLVDDGSGGEYDALFRRAASDPRVRVVRNRQNRGTYAARNDGLAIARGEFVTFHDADDWAHPCRLAIQVEHLIAHDRLVANTGGSLRVTPNLGFVQRRGAILRTAESSILFRRTAVLERVGYFDEVRRSGDIEYRRRIEAAFGLPVSTLEHAGPTTLVRYSSGSLSAEELGDGWMHPARVAYQSAYMSWHRRSAHDRTSLYMSRGQKDRPFPVHPHIGGAVARAIDLDVLVVLDGRPDVVEPQLCRDRTRAIRRGLSGGLTVGVLQMDSLSKAMGIGLLPDGLENEIALGRVVRVLATDEVHARVVVIWPEGLLVDQRLAPTGVRARQVVLVGSPGDSPATSSDGVSIEDIAEQMFGGHLRRLVRRRNLDFGRWMAGS